MLPQTTGLATNTRTDGAMGAKVRANAGEKERLTSSSWLAVAGAERRVERRPERRLGCGGIGCLYQLVEEPV